MNDWRSEAAGGMNTALLLWEACLIPSLLQGASTWMEISTKKEAVVCQAHPPSRARGPPCCAHLGDRTSRYEAEDLQREVDDDNASKGGG